MRLLLSLRSCDLCLYLCCRLVPSCFVIFDLEPLSLSFPSEIFKSLSVHLDSLCHLAILCLDQHAHTLHHLESLLTISLDRLDIFEGRSCISEFIQRISLTGFPAQSVGSSNTDVLDLPCLLVLITGMSQSRQHRTDIQEKEQKTNPDPTGWERQSQSKAKVSHMKTIQLEGLKSPSLKMCYKKTRAKIEN
ncbi:hypothetical protein Tco_1311155 [Tanacetum coccineum]